MLEEAAKKADDAVVAAANGGSPHVSPLVIPSMNSYVFFALLIFPILITSTAICVDVLGFYLPVWYMSTMRMLVNHENCTVMFYTWIKLMQRLLIISTLLL